MSEFTYNSVLRTDEWIKKSKKTTAMMQDMAQLWLQQEVKELEGKSSSGRGSFRGMVQYSPYIVVDHLAMSKTFEHWVKMIILRRKSHKKV